jgi:hypothetical protein
VRFGSTASRRIRSAAHETLKNGGCVPEVHRAGEHHRVGRLDFADDGIQVILFPAFAARRAGLLGALAAIVAELYVPVRQIERAGVGRWARAPSRMASTVVSRVPPFAVRAQDRHHFLAHVLPPVKFCAQVYSNVNSLAVMWRKM